MEGVKPNYSAAGGFFTAATLVFATLVASNNPSVGTPEGESVVLTTGANGGYQLSFHANRGVIHFTQAIPSSTMITELCTGIERVAPVKIIFNGPIGDNVTFQGCPRARSRYSV